MKSTTGRRSGSDGHTTAVYRETVTGLTMMDGSETGAVRIV